MKHLYTILLSIACMLLSFTLTSEQKTPSRLNAVEITDQDADSEIDCDIIIDSDPDNYEENCCAYGPGCAVTIID
ncbi:MAG TPA: hypothetical protein PKG52_01540 [bacterium]|nr:hypothetical protein [bacterium]HPS30622.1 hypothetical protein [bacterium]